MTYAEDQEARIAQQVHVNPEFTRIDKTIAWATGYALGIDICKSNFPLIKPDARTRPPCSLCLGDGLLVLKFSLLTNSEKDRRCIVWIEGLAICNECMGQGQK